MHIKTIYFLALIIIATSCTKVIDVDLNDTDPKIVVDGYVKYDPVSDSQIASVKISKTANYFDSSIPQTITNATLSVINGNGKEIPLTYSEGYGFSANIQQEDHSSSWKLKGVIESSDVEAITTIPKHVKIDSINAYKLDFGPPKKGFTPVAFFTDIAGESNYYRLKISINNIEYNDLFYTGDDTQDGDQITYPFYAVDALYGEEMTIELLCIDEFAYEYFKVFGDNMGGGGFSAAPGNPNSNIEGESMLGVFTGQTTNVVRRTVGI